MTKYSTGWRPPIYGFFFYTGLLGLYLTKMSAVFCKKTHSFWSSIAPRALCRKKNPHIGGRHPVLYFVTQATEKYSAAMYYHLHGHIINHHFVSLLILASSISTTIHCCFWPTCASPCILFHIIGRVQIALASAA